MVTPTAGPSGYRLKEWTESDALTTIGEATAKWEAARLVGRFESGVNLEEYLITIEHETLARFPNIEKQDKLRWQLAYLQGSLLSNYRHDYSLGALLRALADSLNNGDVKLSNLQKWLLLKQFSLKVSLEATNLLGDGKPATVIQIEAKDNFIKDAVIAIHGSKPGEITLIPLRQNWYQYYPMSGGGQENISTDDHNGNGRPEIVSVSYVWGNKGCYAELAVNEYEGQYPAGEFVNIARSVPLFFGDYTDGDCSDNTWSFEMPDSSGAQTIIQTRTKFVGITGCPKYVTKTYFAWHNTTYRRMDSEHEPMTTSSNHLCAIGWANTAGGLSKESISLLENAVTDWPVKANQTWGPATRDYFRFKLGTWYALQGQVQEAKDSLLELKDRPIDTKHDMASKLAQAFLQHYQGQEDTFAACRAAIQVAREDIRQVLIDPNILPVYKPLQARWGFIDPQWDWYLGPNVDAICDTKAAFQQSIQMMKPNDEAEFIETLRQHRIPVWMVKRYDINFDGVLDWIVVAPISRDNSLEFWPFVVQNAQLVAVQVDNRYLSGESYYGAVTNSPYAV